MKVIVDGLLTNYDVSGNGKTILLLHGWGDSLETFTHLAHALSSDYRVVSLDLPGFGKTDTPTKYNLENFSVFVKNFLEKTNYTELFGVIGHSNGGAIAIKALSSNVISCDKLVLLASSGIRSSDRNSKKITRLVFKVAKIPTKLLPKNTQNKLKKKAYKTVGSEMFVAENMQETFKTVITEDLLEQASRISAMTLLIYGDKDHATPVKYGKLFNSKIRNSELKIINDAGHFLHHEKAHEVEELIKSFLDKV